MVVVYLWNEVSQEGTIIDLVEDHMACTANRANRIATYSQNIGAFVKPIRVPFFNRKGFRPAMEFMRLYGVEPSVVEADANSWQVF